MKTPFQQIAELNKELRKLPVRLEDLQSKVLRGVVSEYPGCPRCEAIAGNDTGFTVRYGDGLLRGLCEIVCDSCGHVATGTVDAGRELFSAYKDAYTAKKS